MRGGVKGWDWVAVGKTKLGAGRGHGGLFLYGSFRRGIFRRQPWSGGGEGGSGPVVYARFWPVGNGGAPAMSDFRERFES